MGIDPPVESGGAAVDPATVICPAGPDNPEFRHCVHPKASDNE